jgi:probable biosynthetic protein (TIGR04098 family)
LVLRESIEQRLNIRIDDDAWLQFDDLEALVSHVSAATFSEMTGDTPAHAEVPETASHAAPTLMADGTFQDIVEVGMPLTGLNGLGENPLLKYLGHLRWSHISAVCGVPSREVKDEQGDRLYPTFFYVDLHFPPGRDMASYGENDRVRVVSTVERFGASMLDGVAYLLPVDWPPNKPVDFQTVDEAISAGIPAARLSNIFVKQFGGAEWLKKSRPANAGFDRLRSASVAPDSYEITKLAERNGTFGFPADGWTPLTDGFVSADYTLVPDRDLNGAGLVYFANYPLFIDICERDVLKRSRIAFSDTLLDRRSLCHRRSAYLNNASSRDILQIEIEAFLQTHTADGLSLPRSAPVTLMINARMRRRSDGRLMMVSYAEKVLSGHCLGDLQDAAV